MAWTTTKLSEFSPGGNLKQQNWELAADAATLELTTGFGVVEAAFVQAKSFTSTHANVRCNATSAGVASNGMVSITGCTSGDTMYLVVYGR